MTENYNKFKQHLNKIQQLMKYNFEMPQFLGRETVRRTNATLQLIDNDFKRLVNDDPPMTTKNDIIGVRELTNRLLNYFIKYPVTQFMLDFIGEFNLIVYNWNAQVCNDTIIKDNINNIKLIIENKQTLDQLLQTVRQANRELHRRIYFEPEAYKLSRHYLKVLEEKVEKDKEKSKTEGTDAFR